MRELSEQASAQRTTPTLFSTLSPPEAANAHTITPSTNSSSGIVRNLAWPSTGPWCFVEHWVIADLIGKGGHIRTVPIPLWVKRTVYAWTTSARITEGRLFRSINRAGKIWGDGMTPKVIWEIVKDAAQRAGIDKLAPHDLRRTCARLCPSSRR